MNREKHVYERVDGNDFPSVSSSFSAPPPPVPVRMPKKKVDSPPEQPPPEEWRVWFGGVVNQMSADMKSMSVDIKSLSADIRRLVLAIEGGGRGSDEERGRRGMSVGGRPRFNDVRLPLRRP
ncbi:unnamed protein product [Adineta ricciae]|uniref:Uncharacterized protein n=1 Tax=Adineta ricciae TaxID=249248 RepID=A0A816G931_ADIRI|nr:unnamed protein product [Adineta ricciae]